MTDLPKTINKAYDYKDEWVLIPNTLAQHEGASLEAIGLLTHLLSMPPQWIVKLENLQKKFNICEGKLRRIIKELIELGYVARESYINDKGQKRWNPYQVYANPAKNPTHSKILLVENQHAENQQVKDIKETKEKEKDYASNPTDRNREIDSTDLKPTPAQMILLRALTRRWTKIVTYENRGVDVSELNLCQAKGWVEIYLDVPGTYQRNQIRLTEAGKELKSPTKPKADTSVQEANRALADKLALAMNVKPVGKDYGNYIKVAKDLLEAGITPKRFADYVQYVQGLSSQEGGWNVTVNSLTTNGRMSEYMARQNPRRKVTDPKAPYDMGIPTANPSTHSKEYDSYGIPVVEGKI